MIEPKVGQHWRHQKRDIELIVEALLPKSGGIRARWRTTTGFLSLDSLRRNYCYARTEPKSVLEPFGYLYSDMINQMIDRLEAMDDAELISTADAAEALTSDCWWAIWEARAEVGQEARRILYNQRERFGRAMCGKATTHLPHMWECHGGSHVSTPGRFYCKGDEIRERAARAAIPTKVSLPAGYH